MVYTAREGVYHQVVDKGVPLPAGLRELSNVNFQCAPAARVRPDGGYHVEAVTATASFRLKRPPEFSGSKSPPSAPVIWE